MNARAGARLDAWRCDAGHLQLHAAAACPSCGRPLRRARVAPAARLIATTTVRVNPGGRPFVLGIAVTKCGRARTLCVVDTVIRGNGRDAVRLRNEGGVIVAGATGVRVRSRAQHPTPEGSRRS